MSFIDLDRNIAFVHVPKTSGVVENHWRLYEGRVLYCAAHDSADFLRQRFPELWGPCCKVGFVRNPFAWWVSVFFWYDFRQYRSFRDFILRRNEWFHKTFPVDGQWRYLCDPEQRLLVDRLCHTETLQTDFDWICDRAVAPEIKQLLPFKDKRRDYRSFYDDELREIVAEMSAVDLRLFNYRFEDLP